MPATTDTLVLERDYASPPDHVFAAWTDVATLTRWFGCAPGMLWTVHAWEPRAGGKIHVSLEFDSGPFAVEGEFLVVDPPHRLSYRWAQDERVDVTIEPRGTGSHPRLEHTYPGAQEQRDILSGGWTAALDLLARV
jgi:uncharacterized protein YndB with AHSA1/START domain